MEPQLQRLYAEGARSFEATVVSGQSFVQAGQQCRLRLPNGTQANFTAQTAINSNRVQVLITNQGEGLAWCLSAGQVTDSRLLDYRRERAEVAIAPIEEFDILPVKALLFETLPSGQTRFYIGCDRPEPAPIFTLPATETALFSSNRSTIRSTGPGLNDWLATLISEDLDGSATTLYLITPSKTTKIRREQGVGGRDYFFQGYGSWALEFAAFGNGFPLDPDGLRTGSSAYELTSYYAETGDEGTSTIVSANWIRNDGDFDAEVTYRDIAWLSPSTFVVHRSTVTDRSSFVAPAVIGMAWNPIGNTRYSSQSFTDRGVFNFLSISQRNGSIFNGVNYSQFFGAGEPGNSGNVVGNSQYLFSGSPFSQNISGNAGAIEDIQISETIFGADVTFENYMVKHYGVDRDRFSVVRATYFPPE